MSNKFVQSFRILKSEASPLRALARLWRIFFEVWLYDFARPGVKTGYQSRPESFSDDLMWYSPTETSTCNDMVRFSAEWFNSYFVYSKKNLIPIFVDFGAGAAKTNLIALESGKFPFSIAFELDDELLDQAGSNFKKMSRKIKKLGGTATTFKGDVSSEASIRDLRAEIVRLVDGKDFMLFAYNKNSYGPETLSVAFDLLDKFFGVYVYLYQNPVHLSVLQSKKLLVHRLILDPKLRKNKDWLIATRD